MTSLRIPRRSLAGGEIDPELCRAVDLIPVRNGMARVRNWVVRPKGGLERRPGTERITVAKTAERVRLMPFVRSAQAAYLQVFGPGYLRLYDAAAASGAAPLADLATPYQDEHLDGLQATNSNDVQWLVSGFHRVRQLRRLADDIFELVVADLRNGPFLDSGEGQARITASAHEEGSGVALTADAPVFQAGHAGTFWRFDETDLSDAPKWAPGENYNIGRRVRYDGRVYRAETDGTSTGNPPGHIMGEQDDGAGLVWRYLHDGYGIVEITGVASATEASGVITGRLPDQVKNDGTTVWGEAAFSGVRGYPAAVALWKSALWFAGTAHQPHYLWKSAINGFNEFDLGTADDAALSRGLYDGGTETIYWLAPGDRMMIGTNGSEWIARPTEAGDTVRPRNLVTALATDEGASRVPGVVISGRGIFVDGGRKRLVAVGYDFRLDSYVPDEVSLVASHLLAPGIVQLAYQRRPWPVIWALREDGRVAAVTYQPRQEVTAWHWHDFGDPVESLAVLPTASGDEALWLAIRRGAEVSIERMCEPWRRGRAMAEACYFDSAVVYDEAEPRQTFDGLDHLEGRTVGALVDGYNHPLMTVAGGAVTLTYPGKRVVIGLPAASEWQTLPPDPGRPDDWTAGRPHRGSELVIAMTDSLGGELVAPDGSVERLWSFGDASLDSAPELYTGAKQVAPVADAEGRVTYRNATGWPATVTAIYTEDLV